MTKQLPLHSTKYPGHFALVDDEDFDHLNQFKWCLNVMSTGRIRGIRYYYIKKTKLHRYLHQEIMGSPPSPGLEIDHKDRDTLNNIRENLRWVTHGVNMQNSKNAGKGVGVAYSLQHRGFIAYIDAPGQKRRWVPKSYKTKEEALAARERFLGNQNPD